MSELKTELKWEDAAFAKYQLLISKIPLFHREIAKQVVDKKAVMNAEERGSDTIEESDIIRAFLSEVPKAFYSLMIRVMTEVGFDYKRYLK